MHSACLPVTVTPLLPPDCRFSVPPREGQSTTGAPQAEPAAAAAAATATAAATTTEAAAAAATAAAAAEEPAQTVSTSLLNEVNKIKAAVRDLAGAVGAGHPLPGGDVKTAPLSSDEPTAAPSVISSHQPKTPDCAEHERSGQTPIELDASLSRRVSSSTPPVHPVSSSNSAPENAVTGSDDAKLIPKLRGQSLSLEGEMNRGAANPEGVSLLDKIHSGSNAAGGEQEIEVGVSGTASLRGPRPSVEEELADDETSGVREKVARLSPLSARRPSIGSERSGSPYSVRRSSSSSPLARVPDNFEPATEQQGFGSVQSTSAGGEDTRRAGAGKGRRDHDSTAVAVAGDGGELEERRPNESLSKLSARASTERGSAPDVESSPPRIRHQDHGAPSPSSSDRGDRADTGNDYSLPNEPVVTNEEDHVDLSGEAPR